MMTISICLSAMLRHECGAAAELRLTATTVRDALRQLEQQHPRLHRCVCDETGALRKHINLFVNDQFLQHRQQLDTPLMLGDTLTIMTAVSGG